MNTSKAQTISCFELRFNEEEFNWEEWLLHDNGHHQHFCKPKKIVAGYKF